MRYLRYPKVNFIVFFLFVFTSSIAQHFDPFNGQSRLFHVQLDRYFQSREKEHTELRGFLKRVDEFADGPGWTASGIKDQLLVYEKLMVEVNRHRAYNKIIRLSNTMDTAAISTEMQMDDIAERLTAVVSKRLKRLGTIDIQRYGLVRWRYFITQQQIAAGNGLDEKTLTLIGQLSDPLLNGLVNRYDALLDGITAPPATADSALAHYEAYNIHKELAAAILIDITRCKSALATVYGFPNAPSEKYEHRLQCLEDSVKALLTGLQGYVGILKEYQHWEAAQVQRLSPEVVVHSWNLIHPVSAVPAQQSFEQADTIILQALEPLGQDYVNNFRWLLNPQNGALEIGGGPTRAGGGTSISYPHVPTSFYMKRFSGDLQSMLTMIHEGGHAIHKQLMSENLLAPEYAEGPHFLFEAFAIFNELLLFDRLIDSAGTVAAKRYYTRRLVDFLSHELFTSAEEASFEQGLYEGVADRRITTGKDIDSLYGQVMNQYDVFFPQEPVRKSEWIQRRLFFEDPLYNVNYLYAILVACKLYDIAHADPSGFVVHYNQLLKNGFDDSANHLLKRYMGFSAGQQDLLAGALALMKGKVEILKGL
jgi:hypothetical protein